MKINRSVVLCISLLISVQILKSQSYDVVVSSDFKPTLKFQPTKTKQSATLFDTTSIKQTFKYEVEDMIWMHEYSPEPINAPKVGKDQIVRLYRNYAKAGFGYLEPYVEFSHSNLRTKKWAYGVNVKHHSYWGKVKGYGNASFANSEVDLYSQNFLKNFIIESRLGYSHDMVHCYGYNTDTLKKYYGITDAHLPKTKNTVRHYQHLYATISGISNYGKWSNGLSQVYTLDYDFLYDNYQSHEHLLGLNTSLMQTIDIPRLSSSKVGGDIHLNYFHNEWKNQSLKEDNWLFALNPKMEMTYNNYSFRIGFQMALGLRDSSHFGFYPDIEATFNVVPNILSFYVGLGGDMERYSYLSSMKLNPYLSDYLNLGFINDQLRVYAGTKTNLSRSLSFGARASLSLLKNMPFFFNDTNTRTLLNDTSVNLANTFIVVSSQSIYTNIHGDLTYRYKEMLEIVLNFDYNKYTADSIIQKAWYIPMFTTSLDAKYNLKDKFLFSFGFYIYTGAYRPSFTQGGSIKAVTLKPTFDFNLGFEYRWDKRLSFFVDLNNFVAQRNYYYYDYPSERINFLLGAKYIFGGEKIGKK